MGALRSFEADHDAVSDVAFSPDGKAVAAVSGKRVLLWDVDGGGRARTFTDDTVDSRFAAVLFSPDGKTIGGAGPGVRLWDRVSGQPVAALKAPHARIDKAAYRPGRAVIAGSGFGFGPGDDVGDKTKAALGKTISLWDLPSGRISATLTATVEESAAAPLITAMEFSPDGKTLAAAFSPSDASIQLWKLA